MRHNTQEHRSFVFQPHLSEGKQYAQVTVPNIPMLTAAAKMKYQGFFQNTAINIALSTTKSRPFKVNDRFSRTTNFRFYIIITENTSSTDSFG